jgi:hypothetical protein
MTWRRQTAHVNRPHQARHGVRSGGMWWDLTRPDDAPGPAAEIAARQAGERAALERMLHEPTMIVERGLRVPPFVAADQRAGRWVGVRHA